MLLSGLHTWRRLVRFRIARSSAHSGRRRALKKRRGHDVPAIVEKLEERTLLSAYFSGDVNLAIPDQTTIVSTIDVGDSVTIDDVNVTLDITHKRDQDLDVFLIAPGGTRVELFTDVGGNGDHFAGTTLDDEAAGSIVDGSAPFSATYRPEGSLSDFDGIDSQGVWKLEVTDDKRRESGTLNSWSIEITSAGPPTVSISDVTVTEGDASIQFLGAFVSAGSGGLNNPKEMTFGPDGNLYVSGGLSDNVVRYDGTTGELLGTFVTAGSGGLDGPQGLLFGPDGNLYVTSRGTDEVRRFNGTTGESMGAFVTAGSDGLDDPVELAFGVDGNLYVSSRFTDEVLRYDGTTGAARGAFVTVGSGGLNSPHDLVFGPDGYLYVASQETNSVLRYNGTTGAFIDEFVTTGSGGPNDPVHMVFGPDGDLYVGSALTNNVLRYDGSTGAFIEAYVSAGSGGLDRPIGLLFDADGNLYVSSRNTDEVLRYGAASQAVFTVSLSSPSAETVTVTYSTADGDGTAGPPATAGSDYTAVIDGTITFAPGETTRTIVIATIDDTVIEGDETYVVNLTSATGAVIQDSQGVGTIIDNDNPASPNDIYVSDIAFDTRLRGKGGSKHDERILVTIRRDSDASGVAEGSDAVVAAANVTVEVRNSGGNLVGTLSGVTDAAGLFTSGYLTDLPDDTYTAEVTELSHATFVWNSDLDPTANDGDADGDGLPDEIHVIPHGAAASSTASTAETTSATVFPTFSSFSTNDVGASTTDTDTDVPLASTETDQQPALSTDGESTENAADDPLTSEAAADTEITTDDTSIDNLFAEFNETLLDDLLTV